ncbi:MAG TPA: GDSL-type esterase/lipase family protein [Actinomycetota bacterium]|nr:GDSL-type esterase/lipase family protein [Actinomycetota bacterium]
MVRRGLIPTLLICGALLSTALPASADVEEPSSLASIGDSITRATNAFGWYGDHPSLSWSTGFNLVDGFDTHYERLVRAHPSIWGNELNVARSGATMADAPAQAAKVVAAGADYVTILMGANDLCAASVDRMTPVPQFAAAFDRTLARLSEGVPDARILVASIPDLERLASVYGDDGVAKFVWRTAGICPTVLDPAVTWADRFQVVARERAFNLVLAEVCAGYEDCRFDGFAVNAYAFDRDEVSSLDYFHPSLAGQRALASITWSRSWWGP